MIHTAIQNEEKWKLVFVSCCDNFCWHRLTFTSNLIHVVHATNIPNTGRSTYRIDRNCVVHWNFAGAAAADFPYWFAESDSKRGIDYWLAHGPALERRLRRNWFPRKCHRVHRRCRHCQHHHRHFDDYVDPWSIKINYYAPALNQHTQKNDG